VADKEKMKRRRREKAKRKGGQFSLLKWRRWLGKKVGWQKAAEFNWVKWVGAIVFAGLIVLQVWPEGKLQEKVRAVGQDPWSVEKRLTLVESLFEAGKVELAKEELSLIDKSGVFRLVMRVRPSLAKEWQRVSEKLKEPEELRAKIEYWEKVLKEKPEYRDGLLRLAVLYYQVYEDEKAKKAWQGAWRLDPNGEEVKMVGRLIGRLEE